VSYVYLYSNPTTTYLNNGIYFTVSTNNNRTAQCVVGTLNNTQVINVVDGLGGTRIAVTGTVKDLFTNGQFDYSLFTYVGRRTIRSVTADVYQSQPFTRYTPPTRYNNNPNQTQDATAVFTMSVYLFPVGWQLPGRGAASDAQLPLYIVNSGTTFQTNYNNGNPTGTRLSNFNDSWSIFELIPQSSSTTYGTLTTAMSVCPAVPSAYILSTNNGGSSNTGLIVGLVIGLICGIPILIIIFYFLFRARKFNGKEYTTETSADSDNIKMKTTTAASDDGEQA